LRPKIPTKYQKVIWMKDTQAETVRKKIAQKLDDKINLNDGSEKNKMFEEISKENPNFKRPSIHASISKYLQPEQEKRGITTLGKTMKSKFDDSLNIVTKNGATIKNRNPLVGKNDNPQSELKTKSEFGDYPKTTCEGVGGMMYSMFSLSDEDMEHLTEQERKDVGEMLKPLLDRYANGERGAVIISLGAIMGLFINKKRKARQIRKQRKEELNERTSETQAEFPNHDPSQTEPTSQD